MRRITALGSVAASSTDYAAHALDPWIAAPQQLLASYAQGRMKSSARILPGLSKILSARWLIPPDDHITKYLAHISDLNIYFSYHLISKHLESVDATHLEAQLCRLRRNKHCG